MDEENLRNRLSYWRAAVSCGLLTADEVSSELDQIILEWGENTPALLIGAAWEYHRGERAFLRALEDGLWTLGRDWREPVSRELYWTLRRAMREKWETGAWSMEETIGHLCSLSALCGEAGDGELLYLSDVYELALEGVYGTAEQAAERFIEVIHSEP